MIVRALAAVEDDVLFAARFLERRRSGLGVRLFAEYRDVLERLESFSANEPAGRR